MSHHNTGSPPGSLGPAGSWSVRSFRDALGLAMALADEYAFVNAAVITGRAGAVLDMALAEGIGVTVEPVLRWAVNRDEAPLRSPPGDDHWRCRSLTLLSVRPYEPDIVREQDLHLFRRSGWVAASAGLTLLDWIETDGDLFRSYAYVSSPERAWTDDPSAERLSFPPLS